MYILINKKTNRIEQQNSEQLSAYDKNLYYECYIESFPPKTNAQYFVASNIREETKVIKEAYSQKETYFNKLLGVDEVKVVDYPAITKTYLTCDIVVKDRQRLSEEVKTQILAKRNAIKRIAELKDNLNAYDYKTSKYVDGEYTEQEWQEIVNQRKAWRAEINKLEQLL